MHTARVFDKVAHPFFLDRNTWNKKLHRCPTSALSLVSQRQATSWQCLGPKGCTSRIYHIETLYLEGCYWSKVDLFRTSFWARRFLTLKRRKPKIFQQKWVPVGKDMTPLREALSPYCWFFLKSMGFVLGSINSQIHWGTHISLSAFFSIGFVGFQECRPKDDAFSCVHQGIHFWTQWPSFAASNLFACFKHRMMVFFVQVFWFWCKDMKLKKLWVVTHFTHFSLVCGMGFLC